MAKDNIHGRMGECIRVSMLMIKNMALENIFGLMEENIRDIGLMESKKNIKKCIKK
jgi:hypothetical protein